MSTPMCGCGRERVTPGMDFCVACQADFEMERFYRELEERYWAEQQEAYYEAVRQGTAR